MQYKTRKWALRARGVFCEFLFKHRVFYYKKETSSKINLKFDTKFHKVNAEFHRERREFYLFNEAFIGIPAYQRKKASSLTHLQKRGNKEMCGN
jgi:hypothetical protein